MQTNPSEKKKSEWTGTLAFAGFASTLGSAVPLGYCLGVVNNPAELVRTWCSKLLADRYERSLDADELELLWSAVVSIYIVGGAMGSLSGARIANTFGRKGSFFVMGLLFVIGAIVFFLCRIINSISMLFLGRLIVGIASGLTTAVLPMYHSEIAPLALRGALATFCVLGLTLGVVVGQVFSLRYILGTDELWPIAFSFYVVLVLLCCAPFWLYPESPTFLIAIRGENAAARQQLQRLRGKEDMSDITKEIAEIQKESTMGGETASFGEVLTDPKLRLPLIIVVVFMGGQQLSGINAIFYYSVSTFRKGGFSQSAAEWATLGAGILNFGVACFQPMLMEKVNRRPLMLLSTFFCALFLALFAIMMYYVENVSWFAPCCIACIFLYIIFFEIGIGPIPFFIGAELFESPNRPVAMSMGALSFWIWNFMVGMCFPTLENLWGSLVFMVFSLACVILFLLTKYFVPETRGKSSTAVAQLVSEGFRSKITE